MGWPRVRLGHRWSVPDLFHRYQVAFRGAIWKVILLALFCVAMWWCPWKALRGNGHGSWAVTPPRIRSPARIAGPRIGTSQCLWLWPKSLHGYWLFQGQFYSKKTQSKWLPQIGIIKEYWILKAKTANHSRHWTEHIRSELVRWSKFSEMYRHIWLHFTTFLRTFWIHFPMRSHVISLKYIIHSE